jgi:hypothetical protein
MDDTVVGSGPWQPANEVEAALRDALAAGDEQRYLAVLAEAVLLVPAVAQEGANQPALATMLLDDGATVVPAFTSPEAMAGVPSEHQLAVSFAELVAGWPDPAYLLAIDPGLPVAAHLSGVELPVLVGSVFAPVNDLERELAAAREPADVLTALAVAELHLPVRPDVAGARDPRDPSFPWWRGRSGCDEAAAVPVFTSPERLWSCLGLVRPAPEVVVVDLSTLAAGWPSPQWPLAVNPTSPWSVTLPGEQVRRLPEALSAVTLQVVVPPELVPAYLEQGYGEVSGMVHPCPTGPVEIAGLYRALGLLRPGSPYSAADESAHVVRWRPDRTVGAQWIRDARPRTGTVRLPAGAQLLELRSGGTERLVATYYPDRHEWTPAD